MTRVFIDFLHGLGDTIQFGVILKHLRKLRPNWVIDVKCGRGKHTALYGLCNKVYHDQEDRPEIQYDNVITPGLFENYSNYDDRPGSKITNCLKEVFGLNWIESLGTYECHIDDGAWHRAKDYLLSIECKEAGRRGDKPYYRAIICHSHGNTSQERKNLQHWQVQSLCEMIIKAGRIPIILDWDNRSPLPDQRRIFCPKVGEGDIWGGFGSGDASTIAALIRQAEAFVGIDSGPGKIASSTDTPSLICWTGHHPMQFHDPAPNTLHLIPANHRDMAPLHGHPKMAKWFESHYNFTTYGDGQQGLLLAAQAWLATQLGVMMPDADKLSYVVPNGIGDVVWALHKIKAINAKVNTCPRCEGDGKAHGADRPFEWSGPGTYPGPCLVCHGTGSQPIDIILSGNPGNHVDHRSVPFLQRFPFINSATVMDVPVLTNKENPTDEKGRYRYEPDGRRGNHYFLVPNTPLEHGRRLEEWLPDYPIDWDVIKEFSLKDTDVGLVQAKKLGKFVAFYLGPETGNVNDGHNRGFLWEPKQWVQLGWEFVKRGCKVAVVGADYDRSYWERYVREGVGQEHMEWVDFIGAFEIGETFRFLKDAKCLVSYQCGLAIFLHYLGGNVVSWWRPDGDSIHPGRMISFDERMATAWTNPKYVQNYIGAIYKRETPMDIIGEIDRRGWVK